MRFTICALPLFALLAACSQSDAPSERMAKEAEALVGSVIESPATGQDELGAFAPRNDCADLAGAAPFLRMLRAAIEMRDTDVLIALAADDIKLGFGGEDGMANLRRNLDAEGTQLWDELATLTAMGCAVNRQGGITMPWYFAQETGGDPFETMIATGDQVTVHAEPSGDSARVASLNWDAVDVIMAQPPTTIQPAQMDGDEDGDSWTHVRLRGEPAASAQEGYVRSENLRSVIDYRLNAISRNGRWRITALLAGD